MAWSAKDVATVATVFNESALTWAATLKGVPIQSGAPGSAMRNIFGADFRGGATVEGQTLGSLGPLLVLGVLVAGVVFIARR